MNVDHLPEQKKKSPADYIGNSGSEQFNVYAMTDNVSDDEFDDALAEAREERHEVVASMREIGMSTRAIASATGNDRKTIMADAREVVQNGPPESREVTGTDGKTYSGSARTPSSSSSSPVSRPCRSAH